MLTKKNAPLISLKLPSYKSMEGTSIAVPSPDEKPRYPSFYISSGPALPVNDQDLGQEMMATVKLKLTRHVSRSENGKTEYNYDFDVMGIKFNS